MNAEKLVRYILAHDVANVRILPNGKLFVSAHASYRNESGEVVAISTVEVIEPTANAVRNWLGY